MSLPRNSIFFPMRISINAVGPKKIIPKTKTAHKERIREKGDDIVTTLEKYFELKQKWCEAQTDEEYDSLGKALVKFRDENFTRDDWNALINQSSGRAKFEYTRMMNENFPTAKTSNGNQTQGTKKNDKL